MKARRKSSNDSSFHDPNPTTAAPGRPQSPEPPPPASHRPRRTRYRDHRSPAARAGRDLAEHLVLLAPHLPPSERALIESVFGDGKTCADIARLLGRKPRSVRAQLARIVARMQQPLFAWVVLHEASLPLALRTIAHDCILRGKPLTDVGRDRGIPYHQARQMRQAIITLARTPIIGKPIETSTPTEACSPRIRPRAEWRTTSSTPQRASHGALTSTRTGGAR